MHRPDPLPARAAQLKGEGSGNETRPGGQKYARNVITGSINYIRSDTHHT